MKRLILFYLLLIQLLDFLNAQVPESDSLALVALYNSTNGASWTNNTNWLQPGQPVSTWYGITVNNNTVEQIRLIENNLTGTLPDAIGDFNNLKYLCLCSNQISGMIPSVIGDLSELNHLNLSYDLLSGSIPAEIGNLANLDELSLGYNQLSESIPISIGNLVNLQYLSISNNQLTGSIPIEICNLTNLGQLRLNNNQLSDSIPNCIGNLTELVTLHLGHNNLIGSIPSEIGNLTKLLILFLHSNYLDGNIPAEIGNLTELKSLYLGNNELSGTIPHAIGNLDSIQKLRLQYNELTGPIPEEFSNLINLVELSLGNNKLNGLIPEGIKDLPNLSSLRIDTNFFNFFDLEPLVGIAIATFEYYPQGTIALTTSQINSTIGNDLELDITDLTLFECSATNNQYQWWKDGASITSYSDSPVLSLVDLNNDDEGEYYCTMTNSDFPDLTLTTDTFSLVLGDPTAIKLQNKKQNTVSVFPNPISEHAILEYSSDKTETMSVDLFNLQGYLVQSFISNIQLQPGAHQVQLIFDDNIPTGIYMLVIIDNLGIQCIPIIKE